MPVTNPTAVRYSNEVFRRIADNLAGALVLIDQVVLDEAPAAKDLRALFPAGAGTIADGADSDGRAIVTADDALALVRLCEVLKAMADDDSDPTKQPTDPGYHTGVTSRMLLHKWAVNPRLA